MLLTIWQEVTCINHALIPAMCLQIYFNTIVTPNTFEHTSVICHDLRIFTAIFQPKMGMKIRIYSASNKANNVSGLYFQILRADLETCSCTSALPNHEDVLKAIINRRLRDSSALCKNVPRDRIR